MSRHAILITRGSGTRDEGQRVERGRKDRLTLELDGLVDFDIKLDGSDGFSRVGLRSGTRRQKREREREVKAGDKWKRK